MPCLRRLAGRASTRSIRVPNSNEAETKRSSRRVLVTCEVTLFGLGSHSATGEEWADDENALTPAEAQSFKRACACLGLGRYLYYFSRTWVDLDDHKRPKNISQLGGWATPVGCSRAFGRVAQPSKEDRKEHLRKTTAVRSKTETV